MRDKKVLLANPEWGYERNQEQLRRLGMEKGQEFTVARWQVFDWHTEVELAEFPGEVFNSIHFEEVA